MNLFDKKALLCEGMALQLRFCEANGMQPPLVTEVTPEGWSFGTCAYYRPGRGTVICPVKCAATTRGQGQAWSFPGYFIDRTPYGVIAHELGHHFDWHRGTEGFKGAFFSDFSVKMCKDSGETKLTNYCPNDAEWFAEMFRLFVTNSSLLKCIRPKTYKLMCKHFQPVITAPWWEVLKDAPERNHVQARKREAEADEWVF